MDNPRYKILCIKSFARIPTKVNIYCFQAKKFSSLRGLRREKERWREIRKHVQLWQYTEYVFGIQLFYFPSIHICFISQWFFNYVVHLGDLILILSFILLSYKCIISVSKHYLREWVEICKDFAWHPCYYVPNNKQGQNLFPLLACTLSVNVYHWIPCSLRITVKNEKM